MLEELQKILELLRVWLEKQRAVEVAKPKPVPPNNLLNAFCLAIQKHEGWFHGSRSQRNNNPGNAKFSSVGYLKIYEPVRKEKNGPFAVFKDYETGFLYLKNLVKDKARKHPEWTLYDFFENWAPNSDGNDSKHYAEVVAKALAVPPTWEVKNLL